MAVFWRLAFQAFAFLGRYTSRADWDLHLRSASVEDGKQIAEHRHLSRHERLRSISAAIATAAACKAKKEELSLAIGLSLAFTVVMMVVMPRLLSSPWTSILELLVLGSVARSIRREQSAAAGGMLGKEESARSQVKQR